MVESWRIIQGSLAVAALLTIAAPGRAEAQVDQMRPDQWREDLEVLRTRLPAAHADLFHSMSEKQYGAEIDRLSAAADTATAAEMLVGLARTVALVGDGHTSARILRPELHAYPILVQIEGESVRVRAISTGSGVTLGSLVSAVEGIPTPEVIERLAAVISADNPMGVTAWVPYYLTTAEVLTGLGIVDEAPGLTITVSEADGSPNTVTLTAVPLADVEQMLRGRKAGMVTTDAVRVPRARDARNGPYWFTYLANEQTLFARIDRLVSQGDLPFDAFVDSMMADWDRRNPRRLILDLRSLNGGNHISRPLIHGLIRRGFDQNARLVVLIGRGTFSAGQNLVTHLAEHLDPIFIGEPTAGRPNHYGVVGRFVLPQSGIEIRYSRYFNQDSDPADYRLWQEPHLRAGPDLIAELAGRDPALEAALRHDGERPLAAQINALRAAYDEGQARELLVTATSSAEAFHEAPWLLADELIRLGYRALRGGDVDAARDVFALTTRLIPDSWNAWDSLGEALAAEGRTAEAIYAYERSLALNRGNGNAMRELRVLRLEQP